MADFDPQHPVASQLPTVAGYFARYGGVPKTVAALHHLTPPAADAASWADLLGLADQVSANTRRQIAAARAEDVATFVQTVRTGTQLTARLNIAGTRLGLTADSACEQVFG